MREILYRGKRKITGEWVYGFFAIREADSPVPETNEAYKQHLIFEDYEDGFVENEVDPETVGQYTGLQANGVRIFEGDIVERIFIASNGEKCIDTYKITFEHGAFLLKSNHVLYKYQINYLYADYERTREFDVCYVVIGNIHDNPELLEAQQ